MRTRRSPRNQERLWKALGGAKPKPVKRTPLVSKAAMRRAGYSLNGLTWTRT